MKNAVASRQRGDFQKGRAPFGRLNEGSPEGGEIRNLPPLACLCILSARAERMASGRMIASRNAALLVFLTSIKPPQIAIKGSPPLKKRASITSRADIMTPPSAASSTQTALLPLDRASWGTICLRIAGITPSCTRMRAERYLSGFGYS